MTGPRLLIPNGLDPAALRASRIDADVRKLSGATMGTGWSLAFAAPPSVATSTVNTALEDVFALVIRQMSGWQPGSDLSRYNASAPGWCEIPPEFVFVLDRALEIAELTGGAYDPALGAEVDAAGFGPGTLDTPRAGPGWRGVERDAKGRRVLQPGGVTLDLSSIAKGYAVDLCAERLRALGVASFLMEIGGEFVGQGVKPDAQPWWVQLDLSDMPSAPGEPPQTDVALVNLAVATSGDFVRRRDGASHLFDGRTRRPIAGALSGVAVMHASAMEADAWATALFVLGPEDGLRMAEAQGLAVVFALRAPDGAGARLSAKAEAMLG